VRKLIFFFLFAAPAFPQLISVGLKGGVPLTDPWQVSGGGTLKPQFTYGVRRYIVGPTAEVHLPLHLSFEVDALYRRTGFDAEGMYPDSTEQEVRVQSTTAINDWEIPFLAKYTLGFGHGPVHPFVDAGYTYRHISTAYARETTTVIATGETTTEPAMTDFKHNTGGFTVGGGLQFKAGPVRLEPELRYTHWNSDAVPQYGGLIKSASNQADFLLGLSF
jgi:opacity protein-like surface antigen